MNRSKEIKSLLLNNVEMKLVVREMVMAFVWYDIIFSLVVMFYSDFPTLYFNHKNLLRSFLHDFFRWCFENVELWNHQLFSKCHIRSEAFWARCSFHLLTVVSGAFFLQKWGISALKKNGRKIMRRRQRSIFNTLVWPDNLDEICNEFKKFKKGSI